METPRSPTGERGVFRTKLFLCFDDEREAEVAEEGLGLDIRVHHPLYAL